MDEVSVPTISVNGKEYILVDSISDYYYFALESNYLDVQVFMKKMEDDGEYYISVDDDKEFDKAMELFYNKYKQYNK